MVFARTTEHDVQDESKEVSGGRRQCSVFICDWRSVRSRATSIEMFLQCIVFQILDRFKLSGPSVHHLL